jgi:hypothetical protein
MRKRKELELFNLSFLDLLSGALGAVIFLFIVVPKGEGDAPAAEPQLAIMYDTVQKQFFGTIPDSMLDKRIGDSLLAVVFEYKKMPSIEDCPPQRKCPPCPPVKRPTKREQAAKEKPKSPTEEIASNTSPTAEPKSDSPQKPATTKTTKYTGPMPSVPCKFSVELRWQDKKDNVDLFVCKDGDCVFGGRRYRSFIGYWDSGKSRTSIFGGDVRTSQEAVRQFDEIIPGEYTVLAQFKNTTNAIQSVEVNGMVYSKTDKYGEKGKQFSITLPLNERERTTIGKITVREDGSFDFTQIAKN